MLCSNSAVSRRRSPPSSARSPPPPATLRPGTTAAALCRRSTGTPKRSTASTRRSPSTRLMPTPIPTARCRCSPSANWRAALPNTNGAGSAAGMTDAAPQLSRRALARRISAGAQAHSAARRAGPRRHHSVRALRAAGRAHGRDGRAGGAAGAQAAVRGHGGRRLCACARRTAAGLRPALPARQPAARAQDRARHHSRRHCPICTPTRRASPLGGRASKRCPANASRSPGPVMPATPMTATARSSCRYWSRCSRSAGVSFVSLQRDLREGDAARLAAHRNVTHVGEALSDMAETAAALTLCDLADRGRHLGGASGRRARAPGLGHAAVFARLALDARRRTQPLVSANAAVAPERARRLAGRGRAGCAARWRNSRARRRRGSRSAPARADAP